MAQDSIQDTILDLVVKAPEAISSCDNFSVLLMNLPVLRITCQVFYRMPLIGICMFFWWLDWQKRPQKSNDLLITSYQEYVIIIKWWLISQHYDLSVLMLTLISWLKVVMLTIPHCSYFFSCPFFGQSQLRTGNYVSLPLGRSVYINYLEFFCMKDLSNLTHLFIQTFICWHGFMNIYTTLFCNLENMILSERRQTQKTIYCIIPSVLSIQNMQIYRQR